MHGPVLSKVEGTPARETAGIEFKADQGYRGTESELTDKLRKNSVSASHYSNFQRVDRSINSFSHSPNTTRGRTAKTGSFMDKISSFIVDMSHLYLRP